MVAGVVFPFPIGGFGVGGAVVAVLPAQVGFMVAAVGFVDGLVEIV